MEGSSPFPDFGQGLLARKEQPGTEGGKEWLKRVRLHKYWPTFSQWSYSDFMTITEDNLDQKLVEIGSVGIPVGARGKLVREIEKLHRREHVLRNLSIDLLLKKMTVVDAMDYFQYVVNTPMPDTHPSEIASAVVQAITEVICLLANRYQLFSDENILLSWLRKKINYICLDISRKQSLSKELISLQSREILNSKKHLNDSGFEEGSADWWNTSGQLQSPHSSVPPLQKKTGRKYTTS